MNILLWVLQVLLAVAFLAHGVMMLNPPPDIAAQMNAAIPRWFSVFIGVTEVLAAIGLTLPGLLSGSIILEQIFNWPGMGRLFFESLSVRDYPVIMGLTLMFSVLTIAGQLLADILYTVVDPRVTHS